MSRVATPTDNPIIEAINGWIKEELFIDFGLYYSKNVPQLINNYIHYFNNYRLSSKLQYKTPAQFRIEHGFD
ncbi:MAG: integrase core domain-containing protein [Ruminococcus sp.]|nr:integrase core domain-containing protein [Ruminococcus sp.]